MGNHTKLTITTVLYLYLKILKYEHEHAAKYDICIGMVLTIGI